MKNIIKVLVTTALLGGACFVSYKSGMEAGYIKGRNHREIDDEINDWYKDICVEDDED